MESGTVSSAPSTFWMEELPEVFPPAPRLLAFDFDGTLSPMAPTPEEASLPPGTKALLTELARVPGTVLAVLSGRSLASLEGKLLGIPGIVAFGSHGITSNRPEFSMPDGELSYWTGLCSEAHERIEPLVPMAPGTILEMKGPDLCLHYRLADPVRVPPLLHEARKRLEGLPFALRSGKFILEARPPRASKGTALVKLAETVPGCLATGLCIYAGDDETDEDVFAALSGLGGRAISFKVGPGTTKAKFRLADPPEVERLLGRLAEAGRKRKE